MPSQRILFVLFAGLVVLLAGGPAPTAASATATPAVIAPPGNSVVDQYRETIPEVTGDRVSEERKRTPEEVLGAKNAAALRKLGPEGEAVAETIVRGAPSRGADRRQRAAVAKREQEVAGRESGSSDPVKLASAATGLSDSEGGLGPLLPLLILTAVVIFTGIAIGRWRRAGRSD